MNVESMFAGKVHCEVNFLINLAIFSCVDLH